MRNLSRAEFLSSGSFVSVIQDLQAAMEDLSRHGRIKRFLHLRRNEASLTEFCTRLEDARDALMVRLSHDVLKFRY